MSVPGSRLVGDLGIQVWSCWPRCMPDECVAQKRCAALAEVEAAPAEARVSERKHCDNSNRGRE